MRKKIKNSNKSYQLEKEAKEVMEVESQYVSGEKFNSMPVKGEDSLREE